MTHCLMLHGVGTPPPHIPEVEKPYWVSEALFDDILSLTHQFHAHITIDDGNATDTEIALPTLLAAGLKASFFIPSDRIGTPHYVSEDDIRALHEAGMEIGSHGCAHLDWTTISDEEVVKDVRDSSERLSAIIGAPVHTVAVPYGACDRRVLRLLRSLGVTRAYTSFRGPCNPNGWIVRRHCVKADMTPLQIRALISEKTTLVSGTIAFLRTWRHAGRATLWTA